MRVGPFSIPPLRSSFWPILVGTLGGLFWYYGGNVPGWTLLIMAVLSGSVAAILDFYWLGLGPKDPPDPPGAG